MVVFLNILIHFCQLHAMFRSYIVLILYKNIGCYDIFLFANLIWQVYSQSMLFCTHFVNRCMSIEFEWIAACESDSESEVHWASRINMHKQYHYMSYTPAICVLTYLAYIVLIHVLEWNSHGKYDTSYYYLLLLLLYACSRFYRSVNNSIVGIDNNLTRSIPLATIQSVQCKLAQACKVGCSAADPAI